MYKLWASIIKDIRILCRDKFGIILMFGMPVILAVIITNIQNSSFLLASNNKVSLLLCNRDTGEAASELVQAIDKIGMFKIEQVFKDEDDKTITGKMHTKDVFVTIIIPLSFSSQITTKSKIEISKALTNIGLEGDSVKASNEISLPVILYYNPVLQESFRRSIEGALRSAIQLVENKQLMKNLYFSLGEKELPDSFENEMIKNQTAISQIPVVKDGSKRIPNATQHNIPAWTIFAMFFVVVSLGSSVVREKLNGSFIRLKTLPTNYMVALVSKEITYLCVTLLQAAVIFAIGVWIFPLIHLPALNLPSDILGLFFVTFFCGWCAVSFAICVGVFAQTQEQANGFGAISIVILAALGGLMVPDFAMPDSFKAILNISPLHWCLEAYYGLFLEGGNLRDVWMNVIPLIFITILLQFIAIIGLKRKHLI
jgi:ABC-2 type transport system permease protein